MTWLPGYGLPSTLTPERIKDVLKFTKNQERELRTALDCVSAPVWTRTAPSDDFYRRLHDLLRTADGRETYEQARQTFEENKPEWSGLAKTWEHLAEFVREPSTRLKIDNEISDALKAYPKIAPFIEEVRA